jgi:DNA-binding PadR family transcriptional regulator
LKYQSHEYWAGLIKMSLSRFFILHVLYKEQLHGYEIAKRVAGITRGCCAPTEGSLYPVLKEFVDEGLVNIEVQLVSGRERKVYTITEEGRRAYMVGSQAWTEVSNYILQAVNSDKQ